MEKKQSSFLNFLPFLNRNKIILITVPLLAGLAAILLTSLMKPQYHSYAIVFPTAGNSIDHMLENPNFGYDIEADRLLQILQSAELTDSIARKFKLVNYYQLDTTKVEWRDLLNEKIRKDVTFERTRYMSIQISTTTKDPKMSAEIVNSILVFVDQIRNRIYKKNLFPAVNNLRAEYMNHCIKVDSLLEIINKQENFIKKGFLVKQENDGQYSILSGQRTDIFTAQLMSQFLYEQKHMMEVYSKYEKAQNQLNRPIPSVYVVNHATPSYKKVSPSYRMNVMIAFLGALLICLMGLYIKEELSTVA
jgi:capsular polysaccharide biosynthesis protein